MLLLVAAAIHITGDEDPFLGGIHPQAIAIPIVEAVIAIGMSLWTMEWFRRRWNHAGPLARALGRASYAAYILHAPVVVVLSVGLRSLQAPAEIKLLIVWAIGAAASFGLGWLTTRSPLLARIL